MSDEDYEKLLVALMALKYAKRIPSKVPRKKKQMSASKSENNAKLNSQSYYFDGSEQQQTKALEQFIPDIMERVYFSAS